MSFKSAAILLSSSSIAKGFIALPQQVGPFARVHHNNNELLVAASVDTAEQAIEAAAVEFSTLADDQGEEVSSDVPVVSSSSIDVAATQNSLLRIAASTDRGQYASIDQKEQASQLLSELESIYQAQPSDEVISPELTGTWSLLYSNTQLFRSSPFFLAGRSTCKTPDEVKQFEWFCNMHRTALAISTIGEVRQVITKDGRMVNEFEVKAGAVPFLSDLTPFRYSGGLPVTIDGAIVSSADITENSGEWEIFMDTVEIKGSTIPGLRSLLDMENSKLKSRDLSKILEDNIDAYEVPRPVLRTTFVDEHMRVARDEDGNVFVYGKTSDSEEPKDYSDVLPDLGVASLLEGFNDAITKFYL
jgi:hypothetical protein